MVRNRGYPTVIGVDEVTIGSLRDETAATHRFIHALMLWMSCCLDLSMVPSAVTVAWFVVSVRSGIFVTLLIGVGLVVRPLWRTYRFVASLNGCSAGAHPFRSDRLLTLCAELNLTSQIVVLTTPIPLAFCFVSKPRICLSTGLVVNALFGARAQGCSCCMKIFIGAITTHCARFWPIVASYIPAEGRICLTATELAADRHVMHLSGRASLAGALLLTHPPATQSPTAGTGIPDSVPPTPVWPNHWECTHPPISPNVASSAVARFLILVCMALQIAL